MLLPTTTTTTTTTQNGLTALLAAASAGHTAVVKLLLERGADVNAQDKVTFCIAHLKCNSSEYHAEKFMQQPRTTITNTANFLYDKHYLVVTQLGVTALFMACELGDVPTAEVLLSYRPDLAAREQVCVLLHCKIILYEVQKLFVVL